ncbi:MAG TPA: FAD-dependent oxidoreductase [Thermoanaerobaculia bacterium]|nr:FAD-dependent oxidoreductase [Thermoanaerobaculia bacterium]
MVRELKVVVVGAGAFGGWTALWLRRAGARVTLVDAWGPGNSRSSSGGETRIIRGIYGPDRIYVDWVARAFDLWQESEVRWGQRLCFPTGALWMFGGEDGYARAALPLLHAAGLPAAELSPADARRRFPQVCFDGIESVFYEERAGYLAARRACQAVAGAVAAEGGEVRELAARPGEIAGRAMRRLDLADGGGLAADVFVFACGPWLAELFPDVLGQLILPTRQEVFFFGTPAGSGARFGEGSFPVWMELGERGVFYGIPGNELRGFKVADDTRGEPFDPTSGERIASPLGLERVRGHLGRRFPELAGAPLLEARVCQYENSPDGHLLIDRHPRAGNVWLVGGGSGHGFKLGPALGEHVADLVLGRAVPNPQLSLARLRDIPAAAPRSQFSHRV